MTGKIASFVKKGQKKQGITVDSCDDGDDGFLFATTQAHGVINTYSCVRALEKDFRKVA